MLKVFILYFLYKSKVKRLPFLYFINIKYFYTLRIVVSKYSLIPRCDSEVIIYIIIHYISMIFANKLIDLGTGTGVIALSLYRKFSYLKMLAIDICISGIQCNSLYKKQYIYFIYSNWFKFLSFQKKYHIIITNPPYLNNFELNFFCNLVTEPILALTTQNIALSNVYIIIKLSYNYLFENGIILLEHGYTHSKKVRLMLIQSGFINVFSCKDINSLFRVSCGEK